MGYVIYSPGTALRATFQTDATIRLAIFFKDLLKNIGEIYLQGRFTAKAQTVCLELGPLFSISKSPLHPARVIRGAYTGAVQSYLTFFFLA